MTTSENKLFQYVAERSDLANFLHGRRPLKAVPVRDLSLQPKLRSGDAVVFWLSNSQRPNLIVVPEGEKLELFAWINTFHRDLAPLTSWCRVLSSAELAYYAKQNRLEPNLFGFEAAWIGAIIADAMFQSRRSFDSISLTTCLATEAFAFARSNALYGPRVTIGQLDQSLDTVRACLSRTLETAQKRSSKVTLDVLQHLLKGTALNASAPVRLLSEICNKIQGISGARTSNGDLLEGQALKSLVDFVPLLSRIQFVLDLPAEDRVRLFRQLRAGIEGIADQDRVFVLFAAGYVLSRIGGAERDLRLAEAFDGDQEEVLTWAAVLGGLGADAFWTDAFDGMGRLVARELLKPVDIFDFPNCDISLDELMVVSGGQPSSKARFRSANRNAATVELQIGVSVQFGLVDEDRLRNQPLESAQRTTPASKIAIAEDDALRSLAGQLFPHLQKLFEQHFPQLREKKGSRKNESKLL